MKSPETGGIFTPAGTKPAPFTGPDLKRARQPDDVITVADGGEIPKGTYLGEDKAGPGAFDIHQIDDIAKRWDDKLGGFVRKPGDTAKAYDGHIIFFARHQEAVDAYEMMWKNPRLKKLLDRKPPGIYTMYLNKDDSRLMRYATDKS